MKMCVQFLVRCRLSFRLSTVLLVLLMVPGAVWASEPRLHMSGSAAFADSATGLIWQFERSKRVKDSADAQDILDSLNAGEHADWRLPTKSELFELFQIFDLKNNGEVKPRLEGKYWLAGEKGSIEAGGWEIGDGCGPTRTFYTGTAGYVRAVRGGYK